MGTELSVIFDGLTWHSKDSNLDNKTDHVLVWQYVSISVGFLWLALDFGTEYFQVDGELLFIDIVID